MTDQTSYSQTRWSLEDLFPSADAPEMQAAFADLEARVSEFEAVRQELQDDIAADRFLQIIKQQEQIGRLASRIGYYASLWFSEDTQNQEAQTFQARVDQLLADLGNRTLFFSLWWKDLNDAAAERLLAESEAYRYWLEKIRHFKPHTLSESEEKIINIKDVTGANALKTLYDSITNRYTFKLKIDDETREMTLGELQSYFRHHNPELRAAAYQELYRVYAQDAPILGQIYQALVRDWRNEQLELRNFANPIAPRNLSNDIPDDVVETLLSVTQRNVEIFQRYFKLKARWLGMERLRRYDIYAPVVESERTYDFATAAQMVLESFRSFEPRVAELAQRVFAEKHLDSEVRKGKLSGAFCASPLPDMTPWVLTNYQGRPYDVATLAHELGHAIHSMLAAHHTPFTFHASLPLAETASIFGEMMLVDRLLAKEHDESVRLSLLFKQVDDAYASIQRQTFFALFERRAHELIQAGAALDELAQAYLENLRQQFGEALELSDEFRWEWVTIPHIYHVPFYVYAYSFGQLLVLSLYQQYKSEGEPFKSRYLNILAAGGSAAPAQVLADAGINIGDPDFWQGGFDVIRGLVEQLEAIPIKQSR